MNYQTTTNKKPTKGRIILTLTKEKCTFNELISHIYMYIKNLISLMSYCHHKKKYSSSIVWTILGLLWHNIHHTHLEHLVVVTKWIQTCKILNHTYIYIYIFQTRRIPYPSPWFFETTNKLTINELFSLLFSSQLGHYK